MKTASPYRWRLLCGAIAVAVLGTATAAMAPGHKLASRPIQTWQFGPDQNFLMSWNDTQSDATHTVFNTTPCAWNDEDDTSDWGSGKLAAGQTVTDTKCLIADYDVDGAAPHVIIYKITSGVPLTISVTNDVGNSWDAPAPTKGSGGQLTYTMCVQDPVHLAKWGQGPSVWPVIPNTNGGVGQIVNYTLHITASKNTTSVGAVFDLGPDWMTPYETNFRTIKDVACPVWPG